MTIRATVAGHSYVKYLQQQISSGTYPINYGLDQFHIEHLHISGGRTTELIHHISEITSNNPQVVFIQIGGNDFTGSSYPDHSSVVHDILQLADLLISAESVKFVYIGKLFYRGINKKYLPSPKHVSSYNSKVTSINSSLQIQAKDLQQRGIYIRNHKGREQMADDILSTDGTHLNNLGTKKWYRSIRGAFVEASKQLSAPKVKSIIIQPGIIYAYMCVLIIFI